MRRGREHRKAVQDAIVIWGKAISHPPVAHIDAITGGQVWDYPVDPPVPDPELGLLIGDCLHNFRSALDHLAFAFLADPAARGTVLFPLFNDPVRFVQSGLRRLNGTTPEFTAAAVRAQPCFVANQHVSTALASLECLENIDKHRHLNLMAASFGAAFWHPGAQSPDTVFVHTGEVKKGTVLARFPADQMQERFAAAIHPAFKETGPFPASGNVIDALMMIDVALSMVISDIVRELLPGEQGIPPPDS